MAAGIFLGIDGAQPTGWSVIGIAFAAVISTWIIHAEFSRKPLILAGTALAIAVLLLAALGLLELFDRGFREVINQIGILG